MLNNSFSQNKGLLGLLEMKNGIGGMEKGVLGSMLHSMMFSLQFFVLQYVFSECENDILMAPKIHRAQKSK